MGSGLHVSKIKKNNWVVLQILHFNNYLILPEGKVEKMESCIFFKPILIFKVFWCSKFDSRFSQILVFKFLTLQA